MDNKRRCLHFGNVGPYNQPPPPSPTFSNSSMAEMKCLEKPFIAKLGKPLSNTLENEQEKKKAATNTTKLFVVLGGGG